MSGNRTNDLRPQWCNFARRLQQIASPKAYHDVTAYNILTVEVLVDQEGNPIFWSKPEVTPLEPARGAAAFLERLLRSFGR